VKFYAAPAAKYRQSVAQSSHEDYIF